MVVIGKMEVGDHSNLDQEDHNCMEEELLEEDLRREHIDAVYLQCTSYLKASVCLPCRCNVGTFPVGVALSSLRKYTTFVNLVKLLTVCYHHLLFDSYTMPSSKLIIEIFI